MKLTVLADNREREGWLHEHGLALMLETPAGLMLFDTGAGGALPRNLKIAGYSYDRISAVILSHGHWDHTGGLADVLSHAPEARLFSCRGVDMERFSIHKGMPVKNLTMPESSKSAMGRHPENLVHTISSFTEIDNGIFLTGPIERLSFEDCGGPFFLDCLGEKMDMLTDETALLTSSGTLIQGCCHAGIINTIEHCRRHRPDIKIKNIAGGLHLLHSSEERLRKTADYLNSLELKKIILLHCTGDNAVNFLEKNLDCEVIYGQTGDNWDI